VILRLLPMILATLLLAAHVLRAGLLPLALVLGLLPLLLLARRPWVARLFQVVLLAGTVEWLSTLVSLVTDRRGEGHPWLRLALILAGVTALTFGGVLVPSLSARVRKRYRLEAGK
jgi:hypothetical protein